MTMRVGINGFGRIGRNIFRAALSSKHKSDVEIVHINDLTDTKTLAHLLKYDSVFGRLDAEVTCDNDALYVNGKKITVSATKTPVEIPWRDKKIDVALECTGIFTKREDCELHLKAGAPKVLISAPATNEDITVVYGVNSHLLTKDHKIVSNGSCTTNCLAPVVKVLHQAFRIKSGLMTTVHSYTNDQRILDFPHKDLRRARAAAMNMIPTSTGAAKAIGLVIPELKGLIDGIPVRVPTPNVSLVDATFQVESSTSAQEVNEVLKKAASTTLKGVLEFTEEPLVSTDFLGSSFSSSVDGSMTKVILNHSVKVLVWYDNEAGFSYRMLDIAKLMV